jgi:hypothetical protein
MPSATGKSLKERREPAGAVLGVARAENLRVRRKPTDRRRNMIASSSFDSSLISFSLLSTAAASPRFRFNSTRVSLPMGTGTQFINGPP